MDLTSSVPVSSPGFRSFRSPSFRRLNMQEVQEYFAPFDRKEMLDELLAEIANEKA
ncbi:MAG TPA: hypothetical protein VN679_07665 [Candidatus Acidoferrales bacterium]|nr:hypothetical protein [Candidatus Acidoferrales bacterium]